MTFRRILGVTLCVIITLVSTSISAFALEFRLIDKRTGAPIAGAEVLIVGLAGAERTDADGRFSWTPDPAPPFEVLVILPGGQLTKPILITSVDWAAVLTIEIEAAVNEQITVTAGVAPSIDAAPGAGMTLLSGRDVQLRLPSNLMQSLENVPGVNQVSEGQAAVPAVRGLAGGRTLILIDGARVTSERRAGPSATFLDPFSVDSVDVARGPGSVAYGSDALGGVISVRTRRPAIGSPWSGRFTGAIGAGIPDRRAGIEISKGHASGAFILQAHTRSADDYDGPDTTVLNSGYKDRGFLARADQQMGGGMLTVGWQSDFGRDVERPRNNSSTVRFLYPFERSHRLTAAFERDGVGALDHIKVQGFFGSIEHRTDQDRFATATRGRSINRADITANDFSVRAVGELPAGNGKLEVGMDINGRVGLEAHAIAIAFDLAGQQASLTDSMSIASARRVDTGLFVQIGNALSPRLHTAGGLRLDLISSRNSGGFSGDTSVSHQAISGFGAVTVGPFEGFTFTGQVSRGFRDPTLSDRFFRGPTGRGFITGNPDLDPETSVQIDVGARYAASRVRIAAYTYHYRINNLVERFTTASDLFFFRNRGRTQYRGVEIESQVDLTRGFSLELSGQIARGRDLDDNGGADLWLDDMAPASVTAVLRKRLTNKGSVHIRVAAFSEDERPGPNEVRAPGYTLVDGAASWSLTPQIELRANGRNLLNRSYFSSPDPRWVFAPGRSASITTAIRF